MIRTSGLVSALVVAISLSAASPAQAQAPVTAPAAPSASGYWGMFLGGPKGSHHLYGQWGFAHYVYHGFVYQRFLYKYYEDHCYVYYYEYGYRNRHWAFEKCPSCCNHNYVRVYKRFPEDYGCWRYFHSACRTPTWGYGEGGLVSGAPAEMQAAP